MEKVAQSWGQSARAALNFSTGGVRPFPPEGAELFHRRGVQRHPAGGVQRQAGGRIG